MPDPDPNLNVNPNPIPTTPKVEMLADGTMTVDGKKVYAEEFVTRLNTEAATLRTKVNEHETKAQEDARKAAEAAGNWESIAKENERQLNIERAKAQARDEEARQTTLKTKTDALAAEMGVRPEAITNMAKFIDMTKVTLDTDGTLKGLREQIDGLKPEMPFLFVDPAEAVRNRAAGSDGRPTTQPANQGSQGNQNQGAADYRDRTKVPDTDFKRAWDNYGR